MKVKQKEPKETFKPIVIEITIESLKEIKELRKTLGEVNHSTELYELLVALP